MIQMFCEVEDCESALCSSHEFVTGICSRHLEELSRDDVTVGICWQCQRITAISLHSDFGKSNKELIPKDKYLMARGCKRCTGSSHEGIMWMTIRKDTPPTLGIEADGSFLPYVNKEISPSIMEELNNQKITNS